eukprot:10883188-Karenia_brevis.AAC.1
MVKTCRTLLRSYHAMPIHLMLILSQWGVRAFRDDDDALVTTYPLQVGDLHPKSVGAQLSIYHLFASSGGSASG